VTRVVLDTNVLAPGFTSVASTSSRLVDHWRAGTYELVVSEHLLAELARGFMDPYYGARISPRQAERTLKLLREHAIVTELTATVVGVATHPEDDLVLSTALSGQAVILCTRDKQLLRLRSYETVGVLSPGQFLALVEAGSLA
jgi:putative PIN family toxin of toxin-antitoxin system